MKTLEIECTSYPVPADMHTVKNPSGIILELIGHTSNKAKYQTRHNELTTKTNMDSLVFDYSGHGDSQFNINEIMPAQHFLEVIYVFDWLKVRYPDHIFTVIGSSYGGYLATQLTKYRKFNNLILRAPAIHQPSDFYTKRKNLNQQWTHDVYRKDVKALSEHPLLTRVKNFKGNALVVVHENDSLVPHETTDAYISAFNADKFLATGFNHSLDDCTEDQKIAYYLKIADWIKNHKKIIAD